MLNNSELRRKIRLVFQSYLYFGLFELETGVKAAYDLTPSVWVFSVTFRREEFVWVGKFYEHLKKCFEESNIQDWNGFMQFYDYAYVTYSLVCTRNKPISLKFFRDKKNIYFCDTAAAEKE